LSPARSPHLHRISHPADLIVARGLTLVQAASMSIQQPRRLPPTDCPVRHLEHPGRKAWDSEALLERDEPDGYFATRPSLPGCYGQGDTVEGALDTTREAIELYGRILGRVQALRAGRTCAAKIVDAVRPRARRVINALRTVTSDPIRPGLIMAIGGEAQR
jgi:hypothetical protein